MNISSVYAPLALKAKVPLKINQLIQKQLPQQVTFKGAQYPSGYYTDEEITNAYRFLKESDSTWEGKLDSYLMDKYGFFKYCFTSASENHIAKVRKLRKDIQVQEKNLAEERQNQIDLGKLKPAKNQMKNDFFDIVELSRNNNDIELPNGIMVESLDKDLTEKFSSWALEQNTITGKKITTENKTNDAIISELKNIMNQSNQEYIQNNKRTLLHIEGFEKIASPKDENKGIIAALKALMCSCSEKYKCTVLINAAEKNIIDPILLVDSRIKFRIKL